MNLFKYILSCGAMMACFIAPTFAAEPVQTDLTALQQKADQGDAEAQTDLAVLYHNGKLVTKDEAKAKKYYTKAAKQGNARAEYNLGIMYHEGEGVSQNYKKAREWFEKAAAQNYVHAQFNLGVIYHEGEGVPKDDTKAKEWFQKSCSNNFKPGCDFLKQK